MNIGRYIPSSKFIVIALSLLISGGLVYGADYITHPHTTTAAVTVSTNPAQPSDADNWEAALYAIQAQNASTSLTTPNPQTVQAMLSAAQSSNLTDTVGKTLLINISSAKSQGLGNDTPTQDQIIAAAANQVAAVKPSSTYTYSNITITDDSDASLRAYGNAVVNIISNHPAARESDTLLIIDTATNQNNSSELAKLKPIAVAYQGVVNDLLALPVPKTLSPFHLTLVNDFQSIASAFPEFQLTLSDPLRGIVGIQIYESKLDEISRVFINIAQNLSKDGILFSKGEPGNAWNAFLSPQ